VVMLGDVLAAHLPELRAQAESRMSETVTVFTESLEDPPAGQIDPVLTEEPVIGSVKARIKYSATAVNEQDHGTQLTAVQSVEIHFPSGTAGIRKDQFARVLTSTADAALVGRKFRLQGYGSAGQTTALRVPAEEVS
jgi:hypothetical protein